MGGVEGKLDAIEIVDVEALRPPVPLELLAFGLAATLRDQVDEAPTKQERVSLLRRLMVICEVGQAAGAQDPRLVVVDRFEEGEGALQVGPRRRPGADGSSRARRTRRSRKKAASRHLRDLRLRCSCWWWDGGWRVN